MLAQPVELALELGAPQAHLPARQPHLLAGRGHADRPGGDHRGVRVVAGRVHAEGAERERVVVAPDGAGEHQGQDDDHGREAAPAPGRGQREHLRLGRRRECRGRTAPAKARSGPAPTATVARATPVTASQPHGPTHEPPELADRFRRREDHRVSGRAGRPDAVVVGAGPNGLAAALRMSAAGLRVQVVDAGDRPGGGMRTEELIRPGFHHDVCSTVQPMAVAAPFFREFDAESRGVPLRPPRDQLRPPAGRRGSGAVVPLAGGDGGGARAPTPRPTAGCSARSSSTAPTSSTSSSPAGCARCRRRASPRSTKFALTGLPNVRWLAQPVLRHRGGPGARRRAPRRTGCST